MYVCVFVCLVRGFSANDKIVYFSANAVPIVPLPAKTQSLIESTHWIEITKSRVWRKFLGLCYRFPVNAPSLTTTHSHIFNVFRWVQRERETNKSHCNIRYINCTYPNTYTYSERNMVNLFSGKCQWKWLYCIWLRC